jgi:macrolide transport system ATP-binding/permease protein
VIVIGVTQKSKNIFFQPELELFMPYTTVMARLIKQNYFQSLIVRVRDGIPNSLAEYHFTQLIKQRHGTQDFSTYSSDSIRKTAEQSNAVMTLFMSAIAAISLIVGGIGVMNIMLVSVIERTREIGIRMAVGARQRDIMYQFLIEAILVCLFGGVLGITLSYFISIIFTWLIPSMAFQLSITAIVFACLSSTMIGVIFGFLPARNAARLHPVEARTRVSLERIGLRADPARADHDSATQNTALAPLDMS